MNASLFTYGTLEVAEIMEWVTAARFPSEPAVLDGYARFRLRNRSYPGLVAAAGASTAGTLYSGVGAPALALLDEFEDDCYKRRPVRVRTVSGATATAYAYVIPDHRRDLLGTEPWDREAFLASGGMEFRRRGERLPVAPRKEK